MQVFYFHWRPELFWLQGREVPLIESEEKLPFCVAALRLNDTLYLFRSGKFCRRKIVFFKRV